MYNTYLRWIGKYLTPNQITVIRAFFIFPAAYFWFSGNLINECIAIAIMTLAWYGDHLDGAVARIMELESVTGKWLDPLVDKIKIYSTLALFWHQVDIETISGMFFLDFVSTFARSGQEGVDQGANWFGKFKLGTQVAACLTFALAHVLQRADMVVLANEIILVSIGLASISVCLRLKAWRWLPNILSAGNALCGISSIYHSYNGNFKMAVNLIFFGMFLDLLDGPIARKLKLESKIGMIVDDIADGVTFGLAGGFLILAYLKFTLLGFIVAIPYTISVIVRLLDYTKTKNDPELAPPKGYFRGLPSPAGAAIVGVFVLFGVNDYLIIPIAVLSSVLMTRFDWNWIHFNQVIPKILGKNPKLIAVVVLLAIGLNYKIFLLVSVLIYTASPLWPMLRRN